MFETTMAFFFHFTTVITACEEYNIRGGEVIVNLFLLQLPPEAKLKRNVHLARCDYCQQLCQPFSYGEPLENETHFERVRVVCFTLHH